MVVQQSKEKLQRGDAAPHFELKDTDEETHTPGDFAEDNEALLVVFTCNHCPYAEAKVETLNELAADYDEAAVVGVNPNDESEYPEDSFGEMKDRVEDGTVAYDAYLRDATQEVAADYGARCTPDPFLFENDDGEWKLVYHGRLDDAMNPDEDPTEHYVRDAIDAILDGEEVDLDYMPSRGCSIKWKEGNEPDYEE